MSVFEFTVALNGARTLAFVDEIARDLWRAYAAGEIGESEAEGIASRIEEARRRIRPKDTVGTRAPAVPLAAVSKFRVRKRRCVSPDRAKSRERRRRLAYSGPLPPVLAAGFTTGQLATLRIVADEMRARGSCTLALEAIAAKAGVCVTTARGAIRLAAGDELVHIAERRRHGQPSLTNVVCVISREWLTWIRRGAGGGCRTVNPTDNKRLNTANSSVAARASTEKKLNGEGRAKQQEANEPNKRNPGLETAPTRAGTASG